MEVVQLSAEIDGITKKKDGTLAIKLGTQELSPIDTAMLFDLHQKQIWVAFSQLAMSEADLNIPEVLSEFKTDKSPSARLRSVLYVFWEKNKKGKIEWETYYKQQINKIIEYIKDKLD